MSIPLTAFAGPAGLAPDAAERVMLQQFVMSLQNSAASGMPQLANPAAMAGEMATYLRGYVEKSKSLDKALKDLMRAKPGEGSDVVHAASVSSRAALPGGPARERLDPSGADNGGLQSASRAGLKMLERVFELLEEEMKSSVQEALLINGTQKVVEEFNTLLKSQ